MRNSAATIVDHRMISSATMTIPSTTTIYSFKIHHHLATTPTTTQTLPPAIPTTTLFRRVTHPIIHNHRRFSDHLIVTQVPQTLPALTPSHHWQLQQLRLNRTMSQSHWRSFNRSFMFRILISIILRIRQLERMIAAVEKSLRKL